MGNRPCTSGIHFLTLALALPVAYLAQNASPEAATPAA